MLCNVNRFQFFSGLDVFVDIVKNFPCSERERHWEFWVRVKLIREFFPCTAREREREREREVWGVLGVCEAYQRISPCREREREFWVCVKLAREFFLAERERERERDREVLGVLGVCEVHPIPL
jgi:hypothetical protein